VTPLSDDLLDLAPASETVPIRGKTLAVSGVSAKGIIALLQRFPAMADIFTAESGASDVEKLSGLSWPSAATWSGRSSRPALAIPATKSANRCRQPRRRRAVRPGRGHRARHLPKRHSPSRRKGKGAEGRRGHQSNAGDDEASATDKIAQAIVYLAGKGFAYATVMDFTPRQLAAASRVRRKLDASEMAMAAIAAQGTRKGITAAIEELSDE
jgi:hypothetical protein